MAYCVVCWVVVGWSWLFGLCGCYGLVYGWVLWWGLVGGWWRLINGWGIVCGLC